MALEQPSIEFVLLDRSQRRADFLETAVQDLQLADRVTIALGDAAELAHLRRHRYAYDGVVSRAFGPPAAVAECSAGLLRAGGRLVVSEPPRCSEARWPTDALAQLGMHFVRRTAGAPTFAELECLATADPAYPRTWKQIRKRPLF
ncbi:RsmG family class I SAM-dependent methyltransferase [Candidatus Poriferisodalis multihospitum]|uniref:RsmG family class I SAM-dependent methyltransferase n=1 Tax=Candidatus Poriferisodalis multihospitum TaxID=2983191 RepID=UPI003A4D73F9